MAWRHEQRTGRFCDPSGNLRGTGYSGLDEGRNNPSMERVAGKGPIPCGLYRASQPHESSSTGKYVMNLTPEPGTNTYDRTAFELHGDSAEHPGRASHGCIIQQRPVREAFWTSGDHLIEVVPG